MLSIKRILGLIFIILLCVPFALWEGAAVRDSATSTATAPIPATVELVEHGQLNREVGYQFLIVGKENSVTNNIVSLFDRQKLTYSKLESAQWSDFANRDMVIICEKNISDVVDLKAVEAYLAKGGVVLFAGGLSEYYHDSYLNPIMGVEHKTLQFETGELEVADGFFVMDGGTMDYPDFNSSVWLALRSTADVYISDKETALPIVFSYPYKEGKTLVVNGSLLDNPTNMGIVTALLCKGLGRFAYPVMGKSLTYLDSISDIAYPDELTMAEHGVDSSYLILDKLMPQLTALSLRYNIPYTASVQVVSSAPASMLPTDLSTTWSVAKDVLNYGGELAYAGNFEQGDYQVNTAMVEAFQASFPHYVPNGFLLNAGIHSPEIEAFVLAQFPKTALLRYTDAHDSGAVEAYLPALSYGLDFEGGEGWNIINHLTSTGLFSHRMDLRKLAGFADDEMSYQDMMEALGGLSQLYGQMTWLEPVTITEALPSLKSYESLAFTQRQTAQGQEMEIDHFAPGQAFICYAEQGIQRVTGGSVQHIHGNYYLISCEESHIVIREN